MCDIVKLKELLATNERKNLTCDMMACTGMFMIMLSIIVRRVDVNTLKFDVVVDQKEN